MRSFTLIETLVAISVLLISLVGPLSLAAQALKSAYYARDEITAFYLAQEGLEYVRAVRDQNYLAAPSPRPWLTCLDGVGASSCSSAPDCIGPGVLCQVDFPNFTAAVCPQTGCAKLLLDPATGLFQTQTGSPSLFTRSLSVTPVAGNPPGCVGTACNEVEATATVSWVSAGISRQFQLSEFLFNWLQT